MTEHELTARVALCDEKGRLNPASVGWSRQQVVDTSRIGHGWYGWGRNKRWEYWGIITPTHFLAMTIAALDYANLRQIWVMDRATGIEVDTVEISALSQGVQLPGSLGDGDATSRGRGMRLAFAEVAGGTRLTAASERVSIDVIAERLPGHEAMGTAAPFSDFLVEYTVKDVDRPTHGSVVIDGERFVVPPGSSWAVLDHGRLRAPYRTSWNWGAAAGMSAGRRIGLQLGGGGPLAIRRGISQNAFTVNGRVHKVAEPLVWEFDAEDWLAPWRIRNDRMQLSFLPVHDRYAKTDLLVIRSETHQCFGTYRGRVRTDEGEWIELDGIDGWAEDVHNRW